ncbi:MAG TPA: T9SS type A sorting domain-containing protein [Bacteroidia bacterium]|nr:T9SS type A sorting domain-containing protein [Bacteroidia bacterium]
MKVKITILLILFNLTCYATHMIGGYIAMQHVSGFTYNVKFVSIANAGPQIQADRCWQTIYFSDGDSIIVPRVNGPSGSCDSMMGEIIATNLKYNVYQGTKTFNNPGDYLVWTHDPNRSDGIVNIPGSINAPFYIETFIRVVDPNLYCPISSIDFGQLPVLSNPVNSIFEFNLPIVKTQNDSISYQLDTCRQYNNVPIIGYTYPMGISFNTDYGKFIMSTTAAQGKYGIATRVNKWRNGVLVSYTLVDFTFMLNGALSNTIQMPINSNLIANSDSVYIGNFSINDTLIITYFNPSNYVVSLYSEINDSLITQNTNGTTTQLSITNLSTLERRQPYKLTLRAIDNPMTNNLGKDLIFLFTIGNNNLINCTLPQDLGASSNGLISLNTFPNPASAYIIVKGAQNKSLLINDITGKLLMQKKIVSDLEYVNIQNLENGIYIVNIEGNTMKLIKN